MKKLNPAIYSKNNEYTTKESLFQEGEDGLNIRKSVDIYLNIVRLEKNKDK